jgi:hypothetical protein
MVSQPRHRPQRQFPEAERRIVPCDLDNCPHCGDRLHSRNPWHMRKTVQTLKGPLLVAGRSKECVNAACPHVGQHYYARRLMHILAEVERIGRLEYEYGNPLAEVLPWNSISKPS